MEPKLRNWAANVEYGTTRLHRPESVEQIQEIVSEAKRVKALGTRHAFSDIADTDGDLISLDKLQEVSISGGPHPTATIGAGVTYGTLCPLLDAKGYALPNLASLPHISVVGAAATGTHGSGLHKKSLSAAVSGLEFVAADGSLNTYTRNDNPTIFPALVVGLGAFGVITRVTLDLIPAFEMQQDVYDNLPIEMLERHFDEIEDAAYSVSLFTDWRGDSINQLWLKRDVPDGACLPSPDEYFGAKRAKQPRHPVPGMDTHACTDQLGSVGKWLDRLPHFKLDFTPSAGEELQTEYLMPIEHALEAIRAVRGLGDRISPLLQVTEIRTIAADDLWLSPSFQRDSLAIHFTWLKKPEPVLALLPEIEAALAPFSPRPHWGKIASIPREQLEVSFEKLGEFRNLVSQIDPDGKFRNRYLNEKVFGEA